MSEAPRSKAEKLGLAARVAPSLRARASEAKQRRVHVVDSRGVELGEVSLLEFQRGILRRADIEFDVVPGARAAYVLCEKCGSIVKVGRRARLPRFCKDCRGGRCAGCGCPLVYRYAEIKDARCSPCRSVFERARMGRDDARTLKRVVAALKAGPLTMSALSERVGGKQSVLGRVLRAAVGSGYLSRVSSGARRWGVAFALVREPDQPARSRRQHTKHKQEGQRT